MAKLVNVTRRYTEGASAELARKNTQKRGHLLSEQGRKGRVMIKKRIVELYLSEAQEMLLLSDAAHHGCSTLDLWISVILERELYALELDAMHQDDHGFSEDEIILYRGLYGDDWDPEIPF